MDKWLHGIGIFLIALAIGVGGTFGFNHFVSSKSNQKTLPPPLSPATQTAPPVTAPATPTSSVVIDGMKVISSSPDMIMTEATVVVKKEFYTAEKWTKMAPKPSVKKQEKPDDSNNEDEEYANRLMEQILREQIRKEQIRISEEED